MRYLPKSIVTDEHGSHSGELCDEEPVVTLRNLLKAVLLVITKSHQEYIYGGIKTAARQDLDVRENR
jgi:hypothetical protein